MTERGHNIIVYCVESSPLHKNAIEKDLTIRIVKKNKKYFDIINAYKVKKLLKSDNIQFVWLRDNRDIGTIGIAKILSKNKFKIVFQQGMQISIPKKDIIHNIRFNRIDIWLTPLKRLADELKQNTNFPADKTYIVPIGIETDKFFPSKYSKTKARQILKLPVERKIIGIIGRIDPKKGQLFLVKALSELHKRGLKYDLLIVGEKTKNHTDIFYDNFISEINKSNIKSHIHLRPFIEDTSLFYNSIDVFTMASEKETYGMVTIEALVSGVVITGTNSGGTPEILDYGIYGQLFAPGYIDDFCNIIMKIDKNFDDYRQKALSAQKIALQKYSHIKECQEIEKILIHNLELKEN
ncbi:MAG: glycosyltransferase [Marinilabiliales bacterium]